MAKTSRCATGRSDGRSPGTYPAEEKVYQKISFQIKSNTEANIGWLRFGLVNGV